MVFVRAFIPSSVSRVLSLHGASLPLILPTGKSQDLTDLIVKEWVSNSKSSVAKGQKFWPQNPKVAAKKS
jgi:hypothetical protein